MSIAGTLAIGVTADMSKFESQVAAGATAAGASASKATGNAFSRGLVANAGAIKSAGQKMTLGLTAPLALVGTVAVKTAAEFESSMSQTAAALDKPMSAMGDLSDLALEFGKSTVFSAGEVASAMTELAKGGFSEADIKAGALKSTLDLAAAGGIGLADSAGYITAAMNAFNIEASDSSKIADALAGAADASAADVSDMAAALENVSATAALANQELPDVTGTLAALAQNGTKGAEAGTTLRSALTSLIKPTSAAQSAMKQYGIDVYDAQGKMKSLPQIAQQLQTGFKGVSDEARNAALATIFGTYGIKAAKVLYSEGAAGIREYADASREAGAAQKAAAARMGPTQRALEELSGAWETLMVELGTAAGPVVQKIADTLKGLVEGFSGLPDGVKTATIALGAFVAAAGPVLVAVGSLAGAVGKIKALGSATSAVCGAGALKGGGGCLDDIGKKAGPIASVTSKVLRLGGAMAVVVTAAQAFGGGLDFLAKGWSQQFPQLAGAFGAMKNAIITMTPGLQGLATLNTLKPVLDSMGAVNWPNLTDGVSTFFNEVNQGGGFIDALGSAWNSLWEDAAPPTNLGDQIKSQLDSVDQQIRAKKFQIKATADPAVKAIRQAELAALRVSRRAYRIQLEANSAKGVEKNINSVTDDLKRVANRQWKVALRGDNRDLKEKVKDSQGKANSVKQKSPTKINADGSPARKEADRTKSHIDGLKPDSMPVDADTDPATSAAQGAVGFINSLTAQIYVGVVGPGAGRAVGQSIGQSITPTTRSFPAAAGAASRGVSAAGGMAFGSRATNLGTAFLGALSGYTNPYEAWLKEYLPKWVKALSDAGSEAAYLQYRNYEDEALVHQRAIEDQDKQWRNQQDAAQRRWERKQQDRIRDKQRAEEDARQAAKAEGGPGKGKVTDAEKDAIKAAARVRRKAEEKYDRQQNARNRTLDRRATARARQREDEALAEQRAREDAEREAQASWAAADEAAAAWTAAVEKRVAANESVSDAIISQRDSLRDRLSQTVQWGPSPTALIRNLNKTKAILAKYSTDLQTLQAKGLSKEAVAAMGAMDPAEAGRLASRLLQDPTLITQLNDAYKGVIDQSTDVANRTTAAQFQGVGAGMMSGILTGLQGGEAALLKYIEGLAADSLDAIKKPLGIKSPSTAFAEVGENIGLGLVQGMDATERAVTARAASLVSVPRGVPRGGDGAAVAPIVNNIYPSQRMDERETAVMVSRELAWMVGL